MDGLLCFPLYFSCSPILTFQFLIESNPHRVNTVTTFAMCVSSVIHRIMSFFLWIILICGYCHVSAAAKAWLTLCLLKLYRTGSLLGRLNVFSPYDDFQPFCLLTNSYSCPYS